MFGDDSYCALLTACAIGTVLNLARYRGLSLSRPVERPRSLVRSMLVVVALFAISFAALKSIQPYPHWCFEYFPNWLDHALGRHPHKMYYRGLIVESAPLVVTAFVAVWATLGERISIWRFGCFAVLCLTIQNVEVIFYRFVLFGELSYSFVRLSSWIGIWMTVELLVVLLLIRWLGYRAIWRPSSMSNHERTISVDVKSVAAAGLK